MCGVSKTTLVLKKFNCTVVVAFGSCAAPPERTTRLVGGHHSLGYRGRVRTDIYLQRAACTVSPPPTNNTDYYTE